MLTVLKIKVNVEKMTFAICKGVHSAKSVSVNTFHLSDRLRPTSDA